MRVVFRHGGAFNAPRAPWDIMQEVLLESAGNRRPHTDGLQQNPSAWLADFTPVCPRGERLRDDGGQASERIRRYHAPVSVWMGQMVKQAELCGMHRTAWEA